jgi:glycosyltransferase involved in cell wall biosynthesis
MLENTEKTSEQGVKVCFIPIIPFGLLYGGGEVQAERTMYFLNKSGNHAVWLNFTDKALLEHTDLFHFFGVDSQLNMWVDIALNHRPVVLSSIFWEPNFQRRLFWRYGRFFKGTVPKKRRALLEHATLILPNSKAEAEQIRELFGISRDKMRVIPNGIDPDFIGGNPGEFRAKYLKAWAPDTAFALCAARVEIRKNQLLLAKSCLKAGVPLVLVGQMGDGHGKEGKYQKELIKLVKANPLFLKYLGRLPREEMPDAYAAAKVHALVSSWETPGLVSLEAGLNGCNLVVGKCPPVQEYFEGIAEIVEQDISAVSAGVTRAMAAPRNNFGQAGLIAKKYTWGRVAEKTLEAYREAMGLYKNKRNL